MSEICPICLEDLNRPTVCESTKGGVVSTILVALKDDVSHWPAKLAPSLRNGMADHIETVAGDNMTMKSGKRFFKIEIKKASAELKYTLQGESGSRSFKSSLQIYSPALRAQLLGFMAATANQELVILAQTANKDWHMLGDADEGCEYESGEATSGKAGTDAHGADLTFYTDTAAPTIYKGDTASLTTLSGTRAAISAVGESGVTASAATLTATVTDNDDEVTAVGFRYKEEGAGVYVDAPVATHSSGTPFTAALTTLSASTDYIYYAYMVANGIEYRSAEYSFSTED